MYLRYHCCEMFLYDFIVLHFQEGVHLQPGFSGDQAAVHPALGPAGRHGRVQPRGEGAGQHRLHRLQHSPVQHHGDNNLHIFQFSVFTLNIHLLFKYSLKQKFPHSA